MNNEKRVLVEFVLRNISPQTDEYASFLVEEFLRSKGIRHDNAPITHEFYVYAKPN